MPEHVSFYVGKFSWGPFLGRASFLSAALDDLDASQEALGFCNGFF